MTQEKQKVIRVLQPTKKTTKKSSGKYVGITATVVGVLATSALLFTFLKPDSDTISTTNAPIVSADATDQSEASKKSDSNTKDNDLEKNITAKNKVEDQKQDDRAEHDDGFNEPQPKLNEITNIFKHKKEPKPAVVAQDTKTKTENSNPFDNMLGNAQAKAPAIIDPKNHVPLKNNPLKSAEAKVSPAKAKVEEKTEVIKTTEKAETTKVAEKSEAPKPVAEKDKPVDMDIPAKLDIKISSKPEQP